MATKNNSQNTGEKKKGKVSKIGISILLLPLIIIFGLFLLLYFPIDFIAYRATQYYKDTKEKYSFFGRSSPYVKLYNVLKRDGVKFEFHRCTDEQAKAFGYFLIEDALLIADLYPTYDKETQNWLILEGEDGEQKTTLSEIAEEELQDCNKFLGDGRCTRAIAFVEHNKDIPADAKTDFSPLSVLIIHDEKYADALKSVTE